MCHSELEQQDATQTSHARHSHALLSVSTVTNVRHDWT